MLSCYDLYFRHLTFNMLGSENADKAL